MRKPNECMWLAAVLLAICVCFGNGYKTYAQKIISSAGGVDVTIHGERLYGIYSEYKEITSSSTNVYRSAIVLMPWNNRPEISVQPTRDGRTIVTMNGEKFEFKGRRVCRANAEGTILSLYSGELSVDAYQSGLKKATLGIISRAAP